MRLRGEARSAGRAHAAHFAGNMLVGAVCGRTHTSPGDPAARRRAGTRIASGPRDAQNEFPWWRTPGIHTPPGKRTRTGTAWLWVCGRPAHRAVSEWLDTLAA